jgi:hypothetical protein
MAEFDPDLAQEFQQWAEIPPCPHCEPVLFLEIPSKFYCQPFRDQIRNNLYLPIDEQLVTCVDHLTNSSANFPQILNRDLQPVLQYACASFPSVIASNLLISVTSYPLDQLLLI